MRLLILIAALAWCGAAAAQPGARQQYISDEITVTVRERPANDAVSLGTVRSGAPVTVLEVLGADSFARIRTADGVVGWITARFLSGKPAARAQLAQALAERDAALARVKALENELRAGQERLAGARPAFELTAENAKLRASINGLQQANAEAQTRYDVEKAQRRTLLMGGILVVAGMFCGLLLPLLGRGRKRHHSEF